MRSAASLDSFVACVALFIFSALAATSTGKGSGIHVDAHAVTCQDFSISWQGGIAPYHLTTGYLCSGTSS
ncbi:hypothetical protein B0H10DRAFT_501118 [Mycena sp. CBHHK59/15]|nr:hypothetical protein B0H10DRAFT_501118 [Mycena sp. CBHHK59/15]